MIWRKPNLRLRLLDVIRNPLLRLRLAVLAGLFLLAGGTLGYRVLEHYSILDSVFMTVITLGSVGYGEVKPLDVAGEVFTIVLIVFGLGTAAWLFTTVVEAFVSEQTLLLLSRKRMGRVVDAMKNHYIICGYGRIGQQIAHDYKQNRIEFVVIEQEPARLEMLREADVPHVEGDAADDEVLKRAGIDRAAALITVTPSDASNTFIVLSARGLSQSLYIVSRVDTIQNEAKLLRAGASKVVSPLVLSGHWMGITAMNPAVADFLATMTAPDRSDFTVREVTVTGRGPCVDETLARADLKGRTGALVLALRPAGEATAFLPNPPDDRRLSLGDTLIAIGTPDQLNKLAQLLNPVKRHPFQAGARRTTG